MKLTRTMTDREGTVVDVTVEIDEGPAFEKAIRVLANRARYQAKDGLGRASACYGAIKVTTAERLTGTTEDTNETLAVAVLEEGKHNHMTKHQIQRLLRDEVEHVSSAKELALSWSVSEELTDRIEKWLNFRRVSTFKKIG